jgi:hypothetical protein
MDLNVLQPVSWVAAAIGVCLAAVYYALNLRETTRNRRITLTNTLMQPFLTEEGMKNINEMFDMEWTDFKDFMKKYDSKLNPSNFAKRMALWNNLEVLGFQYRSGLIDLGTVYSVCLMLVPMLWMKFKPVIEEYKKFDYPKTAYENFEYLASEIAGYVARRDSSFKGSQQYFKPDEYDRAFGK